MRLESGGSRLGGEGEKFKIVLTNIFKFDRAGPWGGSGGWGRGRGGERRKKMEIFFFKFDKAGPWGGAGRRRWEGRGKGRGGQNFEKNLKNIEKYFQI